MGVAEGNDIIPVLNELMQKPFDLIVATKDWHPQNHVSFAENHLMAVGNHITLGKIDQILWPVHCVQEGWGSEFPPSLKTDQIDEIFLKGVDPSIDSYSAFYDNAHLRETGLHVFLKQHRIEKLYIAGLVTDYCVKYSALDAMRHGYDTTVILDACRGIDVIPGDVQRAIEEMQRAGVDIITSDQV